MQAVDDWVRAADDGGASWTWRALTLRDDRAPQPAPPQRPPTARGEFLFGDVRSEEEACLALLLPPDGPSRLADLVTADGAIAMDHARLEEEHLPLLLAQTRLAVRCLAPRGALVIKFFEGLAPETRAWIAWTAQYFAGDVGVIKPVTSRPTNSERYLVARDFRPPADPVPYHATRLRCPVEWRRRVADTLDRLAEEQARHLTRVLSAAAAASSSRPPPPPPPSHPKRPREPGRQRGAAARRAP